MQTVPQRRSVFSIKIPPFVNKTYINFSGLLLKECPVSNIFKQDRSGKGNPFSPSSKAAKDRVPDFSAKQDRPFSPSGRTGGIQGNFLFFASNPSALSRFSSSIMVSMSSNCL